MYIHMHLMFPCLAVFKGVPIHYSKFNRTTLIQDHSGHGVSKQ